MTKAKAALLSIAQQTELLRRFLDAQQIIRKYAPRITGAGCQVLLFIALETSDRKSLRIPRLRDVARGSISHSLALAACWKHLRPEAARAVPKEATG